MVKKDEGCFMVKQNWSYWGVCLIMFMIPQ